MIMGGNQNRYHIINIYNKVYNKYYNKINNKREKKKKKKEKEKQAKEKAAAKAVRCQRPLGRDDHGGQLCAVGGHVVYLE